MDPYFTLFLTPANIGTPSILTLAPLPSGSSQTYWVEFSQLLLPSLDTLQSVNVTLQGSSFFPGDLNVVATPQPDLNTVQLQLSGGTKGVTYLLNFTMSTVAGQAWSRIIFLPVI